MPNFMHNWAQKWASERPRQYTMTWVTYALKSWDHEADAEGNFDTSYSFDIASVHDRYVVSLYFVMYMLTSIGFGDAWAMSSSKLFVGLT